MKTLVSEILDIDFFFWLNDEHYHSIYSCIKSCNYS